MLRFSCFCPSALLLLTIDPAYAHIILALLFSCNTRYQSTAVRLVPVQSLQQCKASCRCPWTTSFIVRSLITKVRFGSAFGNTKTGTTCRQHELHAVYAHGLLNNCDMVYACRICTQAAQRLWHDWCIMYATYAHRLLNDYLARMHANLAWHHLALLPCITCTAAW